MEFDFDELDQAEEKAAKIAEGKLKQDRQLVEQTEKAATKVAEDKLKQEKQLAEQAEKVAAKAAQAKLKQEKHLAEQAESLAAKVAKDKLKQEKQLAKQAEDAAAKAAEDKLKQEKQQAKQTEKVAAKLAEDMLRKEKQLAEPERQRVIGGVTRIEGIANILDEQKYSKANQSMLTVETSPSGARKVAWDYCLELWQKAGDKAATEERAWERLPPVQLGREEAECEAASTPESHKDMAKHHMPDKAIEKAAVEGRSWEKRKPLQPLDKPEKNHKDEAISEGSTSASPTIPTETDALSGCDSKAQQQRLCDWLRTWLRQRPLLKKFLNALAGSLVVVESGILMQKLPYFSSSRTQWPQPLRRWTQGNLAVHIITSGIAALMLFAAPRDV